MKKLLLASLTLLFLCGSSSAAEGSPEPKGRDATKAEGGKKVVSDLIRSAGEQVLEVLGNDKLRQDAKRDKVMGVLDPLMDLPLMAKLTLGRKHWAGLDTKQRKRFTDLFKEQIKASYFDKMDLFTDETIEYGEPVPKKKKFHVPTYILSKDQRIEVTYKMYLKKQAWKIYDMDVEGVSMIRSYGSQYNEFLRDNTFADLLERMRENIRNAKDAPAVKVGGEPEDAEDPASE